MNESKQINVAIGFITGRKSFRKVLKTYVYRWKQISAAVREKFKLHLFVAYDLEYHNTNVDDYINIHPDILNVLDSAFFIGRSHIQNQIKLLQAQGVVQEQDGTLFFDKGYAGKRNAILYYALRNKIDYLIFLDDDEYPLAVTKKRVLPLWSGQDVFACHLKNLKHADITTGYHCGYISPIPYIQFNDVLSEEDMRIFIEAISNDILDWEKLKRIMQNGGVTYADPQIFIDDTTIEVEEVNGAKFISGSNLGVNLTRPERVNPFFNPPKARGEDTFLSTCLSARKVLRIPCYTFHDGFSVYSDLLDGVLPLQLKHVNADNEETAKRFYRACIGWIRYKPLYVYITKPEKFSSEMDAVRKKLNRILPQLCRYFDMPQFKQIGIEFERYCKAVKYHYGLYVNNQQIWERIRSFAVEDVF